MKILTSVLLVLCFAQPVLSQANKKERNVFESNEGGYILAPSHQLDEIEPEANWIWDWGAQNPKNYFLHIRKKFNLSTTLKEARAFVSAFSFAELYINGKHVDRVPTNPDPEYQTYEEIDLIPYLRKGTNTIAALVYNAGVGLHHRMEAQAGFFFQAQIIDKDDRIQKVNSDRSWKVARAIAWDNQIKFRQHDRTIGMQERYNAQLANEGWEQSLFDDSKWEQAKELGVPPIDPWNQMVVIKRERLFYEEIKPVRSWNTNGYNVYDFGRVITAFPRFRLTANSAGIELILGTGERLDNDSIPMMKDNVDYTDIYISKKGNQSWQPITWRGFRYYAIKEDVEVFIEDVSALFRSFPVRRGGRFSCSDKRLNQIWELGRWTMQICAHDTWMDTPWREQTQYIAGDSRYMIRYAAYSFDPNIKLLHDYNILSGSFSQRHSKKGAIRSRYPTGYHLGPTTSTYIPDYQLEWILMLHEYYEYYKDPVLLRQVYPNLKALLKYFEGYLSAERGLIANVPGWVVLDHPDTYKMDVDGENTAVNCLYYAALNSAAWMARNVMKEKVQAEQWEQKAIKIKTSIQKHLWSEDENAFKDGFASSRITQQTQVYALQYGLVPKQSKSSVLTFIKRQGRSCEQSFSYWLLNTLFSEGEGQWALDYIRTHWGAQMNEEGFGGAWNEMWNAPEGMSRSHAWSAGPTALLPEKVLGIAPLLPGWEQFTIKPNLFDLEWAEANVPSKAGNIFVKLKKINQGEGDADLQINVLVPVNTSSKVYVPISSGERFAIFVNHKKIWNKGKFISVDGNISFDSQSDDHVILNIQSGSYKINVISNE
jgi:hypothetical protein